MKTHYSSNPRKPSKQVSAQPPQQHNYQGNFGNTNGYGIPHAGYVYPLYPPGNLQHPYPYPAQAGASSGYGGYYGPPHASNYRPAAPKSSQPSVSSGTIRTSLSNKTDQDPALEKSDRIEADDLCQRFNSLKVTKAGTPTHLATSQPTSNYPVNGNKGAFDFAEVAPEEEFDNAKIQELEKMEQMNMRSTSESVDAMKAVANGHVFSKLYMEQQGRMVLRPVGDETVDEALQRMMQLCSDALVNKSVNWRLVVQDNDKYNLLSDSCHKKKIVMKTVYIQAVLSVVRRSLKRNLPPGVINSCKLAREIVIGWIGFENAKKCWIPHYGTIYTWFRDFTKGRQFSHPESKRHEQYLLFDSLDALFDKYPNKLESLKEHIRRIKFERGDVSLIQISYEIFHFFVEEVAGGSASRMNGAITNSNGQSSAMPQTAGSMTGPLADFVSSSSPSVPAMPMARGKENLKSVKAASDGLDLIKIYKLEGLKWMTLYDWMAKNNL